MNSTKQVICFGEVLWDLLPTGAVPGGAPMNVAIRLQSLGIKTKMVSRLGMDTPGRELEAFMKQKGVETRLLQYDDKHETGKVNVQLDNKGNATYQIVNPVAWDFIQATDKAIDAVEEADAMVFGSLICRNEVSKNTLFQLLEKARFKVFDLNLRNPFYSVSLIKELLCMADLVKLNEKELLYLATELGSKWNAIRDNILFLSEKLHLKSVCVTRGEDGAILLLNNEYYLHNGYHVQVADTVGAGDSFLAALLSKWLTADDYDEILDFACALGAIVASKHGANPDISESEIYALMNRK